ncbi:MAG: GspE/PulE/PilB domain-containing protein [Terriglobales bacterium]
MSGHRKKRLGEVLRERKRVKAEDLDQVLLEQQEKGGTSSLLGELLLQRNFVGKEDLVSALEEVTKFRYVDARFATVEKAVLKLVPQQVAERYVVLPLVIEGRRIVAVMAEPQNLKSLDELRFITGMDVVPRLGFRSEIEEAIRKCYAEVEPTEEDIAAIPAKAIPFIDQVDI